MTITKFETDNRDLNTTWLILPDGTSVEVDPCELFLNTVENNHPDFSELAESLVKVIYRVESNQ